MCGDDSASQEAARRRQQEVEREARIKKDVGAINKIFGITDVDYSGIGGPEPEKSKYQFTETAPGFDQWRESPEAQGYQDQDDGLRSGYGRAMEEAGYRRGDDDGYTRTGYRPEYETAMEEWRGAGATAMSEAEANKAAREELYGTTSADIMDYFKKDLGEQESDYLLSLEQGLARTGQRGGSSEIDEKRRARERVEKTIADLTTRTEGTVSGLRSSDEESRLNMIRNIRAGMSGESAISSALSSLRTSAEQAKTGAMAQSLGDVFADLGGAYKTGRYVEGAGAAGLPYRPKTTTVPGTSYRGTIT